MAESNEVVPIGSVAGMAVVSLSTGNKLGSVSDVRIDPVNGQVTGLSLAGPEEIELPYGGVHSFGRDAVMAVSDDSVARIGASSLSRCAKDLIGAKVVMESGDLLGEITDVLFTLKPPPVVLYEVRRSLLDRLLGRTFFIPASVAYALSDDAARLVVPDLTSEIASYDVSALNGPVVDVKSFPAGASAAWEEHEDETVVRDRDEDATILRLREDNDETILMRDDEEATILRRPPAEE